MFEKRPLREAIGAQLGGGTPSRAIPSYWGGSIPWASVKDFTDDGAILASTVESITPEGLRASSSNLIPSGTPLVCTRMAVGRSAVAPMPVAINQDVKALVPADGVGGSYLLRLLQYIQPAAASAAIGSTVKGIRIQDYLSLPVPLAPQTEQHAIVEVLDTLDTTIRQTEAIIAKLKQVKQGLLHDLLTRGIDANGELRPSQSEAPHLYKASPLGWIPKEWMINSLESVAHVLDPNPSHRNPIYVKQGFPFISTVEFLDTDEVETDTPRRVAESTVIDQERICAFGAGSIGFSRKGTIGETRFLPTGIRFALLDSLCVINAKSKIIPNFLMHSLRGFSIQRQIKLATMGVALPQLSIGRVRELLVLIPSLDEQQKISQPIDEIVERIGSEMRSLGKLQRVKTGLMDDLLTGRVRVTPLLKQEVTT